MSKSLVKLIDNSLLPAALLVVGKFFGLFIAIQVFELHWGLRSIPNAFFSVRAVLYTQDIIIASTYSDLFMFLVIAFGFSFVLVQALFFHSTHVEPKTLVKLASNNLLGLIKSSFDIYHKAAIWGMFLWLSNIVIFINVVTTKTEYWVLLLSFFVSTVLTVTMLRDVSDEIELSKKNLLKNG